MSRFLLPAGALAALLIASSPIASIAADAPAKPAAASAELKTVDEVLQKWVDAIGGEAAVRKLKTRVSKGTLTLTAQGVSIDLKVEAKAPNQRLMTIFLPGGAGEMLSGYDGKTAWRQIPGVGNQTLSGSELEAAKDEADFWETIEFKRRFQKLELKPSEKVEGKDCYVVEAAAAKGAPQKIFFSKETGLILRRDAETITPNGTANSVTLFDDYRSVDGMKLAFKLRRPQPEEAAFTFVTTEVSHPASLEDSRFKQPESK